MRNKKFIGSSPSPSETFSVFAPPKFLCPKHGVVDQVINSTIPDHKGSWCMRCWLELIGPPLEPITKDTADER